MAILKDLIVQGQSNFIGIPTAPTAPSGTSTTQIATTEFVQGALGSMDTPWEAGSGTNSAVLKGGSNTASGNYSVAEGQNTIASGSSSHAEGNNTIAGGDWSHAEGYRATANGARSHAEGRYTEANGDASHAEGYSTKAIGENSHTEGYSTEASGSSSHAEGRGTSASNESEHASGRYNISTSASTTFGNSGNTLFSVGNGITPSKRHNAFEIRQNGDIYIVDVDNGSGDTYDTKGMLRLQDCLFSPDIEEVISSALNDLNERIGNAEELLSQI